MRPPLLRPRTRHAVVVLAAAAALVAGCSSSPPPDGPSDEDRVATVRQLRGDVGPAASELGSAATTVVERLDDLHAEWPTNLDARRAAVEVLRRETLPALAAALDGYGPELAGAATGTDADATRTALAASREAATDLHAAAARDLDLVVTATEAEARLGELVATWEAPGSRSEQLARLATTADEATELAGELAEVEDVPGCRRLLRRREEAARVVASATEELRGLVAARRGTEFDDRRRELLADPFGTSEPLPALDRDEVGCWREEGPVAAAAGEVRAALERLEAALNPTDLADPPAS